MKLTKGIIRSWCSNADYNRGRRYFLERKELCRNKVCVSGAAMVVLS